MKKFFVCTIVVAFVCFANANLFAQDSPEDRKETDLSGMMQTFRDELPKSQRLAEEISKAVGVSISPLLGMSVLGGYNYLTTPPEKRNQLAWHNSPIFWGPLLVILLAFIVKDSAKTVLPIPKPVLAPLDALEAVENKVSGLIGLPVALSLIIGTDTEALASLFQNAGLSLFSVAHAGGEQLALSDPVSAVKTTLTALIVSSCFFLVWLVSHTINVLILLCPFSTIDLMLKMLRNSVIAVLLGASMINSYLGLFVSLMIIVFAYFAAGWSFRFMVFGSLFSSDILLRRSKKCDPDDPEIRAFAGKDLSGVPSMTYGTLKKGDGSVLEFTYRPWLLFPSRKICSREESRNYEIGKGTLSPIVLKPGEKQNSYLIFFRIRSMYKSHEESVAEALGIDSVRDVTISRGIREGWRWLCAQGLRG